MSDEAKFKPVTILMLEALIDGAISTMEAIKRFDITRPGAEIHHLRKRGVLIDTELMPNERGGKPYARYHLSPDDKLASVILGDYYKRHNIDK